MLSLLLALPLLHMPMRDDVRQLQSSPAALMKSQQRVQMLLRWSSPGQFYLVSGSSADQVLQREEQLTAALAGLMTAGELAGWTALSDWTPSQARQRAARVQLALAPAGTGKTAALRVLAAAWTASGGAVIGLAPSGSAGADLPTHW